jgi:hypothetical protein
MILPSALAMKITSHEIMIIMHVDKSGYVQERYTVRFDGEDERVEVSDLLKNGATIADLARYGVKQNILVEISKSTIVPEITQASTGIITLQYNTNVLVQSAEWRGKQEIIGITEKLFSFYDGSRIALPYDPPTDLTIKVPTSIKLAEEITPPPETRKQELADDGTELNVYGWSYRHPFDTNKFRVVYEEERTIQSTLSLETILKQFSERFGNPFYVIAGVIILILAIWYRNQIISVVTESFAGEHMEEIVVIEKKKK